jgi:penicillin V acylase-like amidase (Ntn superfamily)
MTIRCALLALCAVGACHGCSNFLMENDYRISCRTMDLGGGLEFGVRTIPAGAALASHGRVAAYGMVAFVPGDAGVYLPHFVTGGMNTAGLSCDQQVLQGTRYANPTNASTDVGIDHFCEWALGSAATVREAAAALRNGSVTAHGPSVAGGQHFVLRDAAGESLAVEWLDGTNPPSTVALDLNDGGTTGYGVFTNEPPFPWHVANVRHAAWKMANARPAFTVPGTFYPDERFLRLHLLKSAMPPPASYEEAMMQALHVLNSVTVPMGQQLGTDSSAGEGAGDHTMWASVMDHKKRTIYWRTQTNQNLQRLALADARLEPGAPEGAIHFGKNDLPWFHDAASAVKRL